MNKSASFTSALFIDHAAQSAGDLNALSALSILLIDDHELKNPHRVGSGGRQAAVSDRTFPASSRRGLKNSGKQSAED